jgi:hypothetical protein
VITTLCEQLDRRLVDFVGSSHRQRIVAARPGRNERSFTRRDDNRLSRACN